mmetsp:Transcript_79109/g.191643  ORF Transcript_79109/g.191643 Transcript_79109/m.191643 type:complete len:224 (+) Transcript_79109:78-749(+)
MMIWSTRSTVKAASEARRSASFFTKYVSNTPASSASNTPSVASMSTPAPALPAEWAAYKAEMVSAAVWPAFSASVRANTSNDSAYLLMAYCAMPGEASPNSCRRSASSISTAPAPATIRLSVQRLLTVFTPSVMARSMSSSRFIVLPRSTMVEMPPDSASSACLKTVTRRELSSCTDTDAAVPISSSIGGPSRAHAVAPTDRHNLRSSNLDSTLMLKMLNLSM